MKLDTAGKEDRGAVDDAKDQGDVRTGKDVSKMIIKQLQQNLQYHLSKFSMSQGQLNRMQRVNTFLEEESSSESKET